MEFIKAEEFLKQPKEVQEIFLNWWQPSVSDLLIVKSPYVPNEYMTDCILEVKPNVITTILDFEYDDKQILIPLLSEGQIRRFIEDKTGDKITIKSRYKEYILYLYDESIDEFNIKFENSNSDLFKLYWNVALEVAKEEVENGKDNIPNNKPLL